MRIGQGFDVHAFGSGDHVMLGGVRIEHSAGLRAHSDGDVVIHALCDAILGALALGDIGHLFPDHDARWADADSRDLLRSVVEKAEERGFEVHNADMTVICQAPKLAPHIVSMRNSLAEVLGMDIGGVSVKATTTEQLGFTGREEGIAASAVVLLKEISP